MGMSFLKIGMKDGENRTYETITDEVGEFSSIKILGNSGTVRKPV